MYKKVIEFFDRLEDKVRGALSRHPIVYALVGGTAIVLFWKGIWDTANLFPILNGPVSIIISVVVLLISGLFVSFFIGDETILSGLRREKKLAEKTEKEVKSEVATLKEVQSELRHIESEIQELKGKKSNKRRHVKS